MACSSCGGSGKIAIARNQSNGSSFQPIKITTIKLRKSTDRPIKIDRSKIDKHRA